MTTAPAVAALLATLALGVVVGLLYLNRARRPMLVTAHWMVALAAGALVLWLAVRSPEPGGLLPLGMIGLAGALGWGAGRLRRRGAQLALAAHAVFGVAGFLVFLAWIRVS